MTNFLKNIAFFKSQQPKQVYTNTLYNDFLRMCKLPFYKQDSEETKNLMEVLKVCQSDYNKRSSLTKNDFLRNFAVLYVALLATNKWLAERKIFSSRFDQVKKFKLLIEDKLKFLIYSYCLNDIKEFSEINNPLLFGHYQPKKTSENIRLFHKKYYYQIEDEINKILGAIKGNGNKKQKNYFEKVRSFDISLSPVQRRLMG